MSTSLYRAYNEAGGLLYIGITSDHNRRLAVHASSTPWWREVDRVEVEDRSYEDRYEAERAERDAIRNESPFHNRQHKLPGCPTCDSPSPEWHPIGGIGIDIDGEPFMLCTDPFHYPGDELAERRHEIALGLRDSA